MVAARTWNGPSLPRARVKSLHLRTVWLEGATREQRRARGLTKVERRVTQAAGPAEPSLSVEGLSRRRALRDLVNFDESTARAGRAGGTDLRGVASGR